ncbi:MAG: hypothetical protein RBS80_23180 [Thermoguttaceae bacterium]|jgi:hypothetical protein|nr:hypothetical protein [Thermoguttaceae bacterium]
MKLVAITFHFEYTDAVEAILDRHGIADYVRFPMIEGKDSDGKHFGSQVFPGNSSVVHAQVPEETLDAFLEELARFRDAKPAHRHLEALVLPVERRL